MNERHTSIGRGSAVAIGLVAWLALGCVGVPPDGARPIPGADADPADVSVLDGSVPETSAAADAVADADADAGAAEVLVPDPRDAGGADDGGVPGPYTIVVLPDTQYYASSWPQIFAAQTRWIVDNKDAQRIAFVLHTGDIVDTDLPAQWEPAAQSLHALDGEVPYVLAAGNHDYANLADRMGLFNAYFPPSHFAQFPWFGGTFEVGHAENSFSVLSAGSERWLVLALEFGPRDEVLAWASQILSVFRDTPAIIVTHAYLHGGGARYDHNRAMHQRYNPHDYVMMGQSATTINDGEEMWSKVVEPNHNVKLVVSGHDVSPSGDLPPGTSARLTSTRADGTRVHQLLANYQSCLFPPCETNPDGMEVHGGNGFLRLLRLSPAEHTLTVTTYSPYIDQFLTDDSNQFTLPLD